MSIAGKVAIVTGGSRGIGRAIAAALLSRGTHVVIAGMDEASLEATAAELQAAAPTSSRVVPYRTDVRRADAVQALMDKAAERLGGVDILVNNAGIRGFAPVADMSPDDWEAVVATNLTGVFQCCRAVLPHLRRRGGGWIINISSLSSQSPFAGGAAYCASKAGLNAFSDALMQEVRHEGIRVSTVLPGSVNTRFGGHDGKAEWKLAPEDVAAAVVDLLAHPARSLPSRVELRPSCPPRKG